jgi:hypothetical protein
MHAAAMFRRLLLDRRHRSVALVSISGAVLGGITYRVFGPQVGARLAWLGQHYLKHPLWGGVCKTVCQYLEPFV